MIKLIKAEIKKVFHKKSIYIVSLIFVAFCVLANYIYKTNSNMDYTYYSEDIDELRKENESLNLNDSEDLYQYVNNSARIEMNDLTKKYSEKWKKECINEYMYQVSYNVLSAKYIEKNEENILKAEEEYQKYINALNNDDWKFFVNIDIENTKSYKEENENSEKSNKRYEEILSMYEYRLKNNVLKDGNYLDNAVNDIIENSYEYYNLKYKEKLTDLESDRLKDIEESRTIDFYILENKVDVNNTANLRGVLSNFNNEFGIFILIYAIMIAGAIVSEEFNKGTIKQLLTKPYKRSTILASKLITVFILLLLFILGMCIIEFLIGGLMLGFESLNIPIVVYSASTNTLITYSVLKYLVLSILVVLPIYLILALIAFMISTISASTSAAITISFIFYLVSNVICALAITYKLKVFKLLIPLYWDFSYILTNTDSPFNVGIKTSILVCIIYIVLLIALPFIYFNKKDVKNI